MASLYVCCLKLKIKIRFVMFNVFERKFLVLIIAV